MTSLRERLERKIANNAQIYKPHGLVNSWRINYCTGAHSLLPLVLELEAALKFYLECTKNSFGDGSSYEEDDGARAFKALQAIKKFVGDEK